MLIIFELTHNCPCSCPFCTIKNPESRTLSLGEYVKILKLFSQLYKKLYIILSGGEPSLIENLYEYVEVGKTFGTITVVTNAYNLKTLMKCKPDAFQLSIDYFGEKHDEVRGVRGLFENCKKLIEYAKSQDIQVIIRTTIMKDNINDIILLREYFNDLPILGMVVKGCKKLKPSNEDVEKLKKLGVLVSHNCIAGRKLLVITPELEVLPCFLYRKVLGRIERFTLEELQVIIEEGLKVLPYACEESI